MASLKNISDLTRLQLPRVPSWLLIFTLALISMPAAAAPHVGDSYTVTREEKSEHSSEDGSSGSSFDRDTIMVRVINAGVGGFELQYDLPPSASKQDRQDAWQFPARVLMPLTGTPQLLNGAELSKRVDAWLARAGWTREACGQWIFTWNAFKVECDPQSVVGMVEAFDLEPPELRDGALYRHSGANQAMPLHKNSSAEGGSNYSASMPIDSEQVRRDLAQTDIVVAKLTGKSLSEDAASAAHAATLVSGTIEVTFEADVTGMVEKRTVVTTLKLVEPGGKIKTRKSTETLTRTKLEP